MAKKPAVGEQFEESWAEALLAVYDAVGEWGARGGEGQKVLMEVLSQLEQGFLDACYGGARGCRLATLPGEIALVPEKGPAQIVYRRKRHQVKEMDHG